MSLLHRVKQLEQAVNGDACPVCRYDPACVRYVVTFVTPHDPPDPDEGRACPACGHVSHYSVGFTTASGPDEGDEVE